MLVRYAAILFSDLVATSDSNSEIVTAATGLHNIMKGTKVIVRMESSDWFTSLLVPHLIVARSLY